MFTWTFNKPANEHFFEAVDAKGVKIRLDNGKVLFKAVNETTGPDVWPLEPRERGGRKITAEGPTSDPILEALKEMSPKKNPFYTLERLQDGSGWIILRAWVHPTKKEPTRFRPNLRLWAPGFGRQTPAKNQVSPVAGLSARQFIFEVRQAYKTLSGYNPEGKPGRPPAKITDARELVDLFETVAHEVLPRNEVQEAFILLAKSLRNDLPDLLRRVIRQDDTEGTQALTDLTYELVHAQVAGKPQQQALPAPAKSTMPKDEAIRRTRKAADALGLTAVERKKPDLAPSTRQLKRKPNPEQIEGQAVTVAIGPLPAPAPAPEPQPAPQPQHQRRSRLRRSPVHENA